MHSRNETLDSQSKSMNSASRPTLTSAQVSAILYVKLLAALCGLYIIGQFRRVLPLIYREGKENAFPRSTKVLKVMSLISNQSSRCHLFAIQNSLAERISCKGWQIGLGYSTVKQAWNTPTLVEWYRESSASGAIIVIYLMNALHP